MTFFGICLQREQIAFTELYCSYYLTLILFRNTRFTFILIFNWYWLLPLTETMRLQYEWKITLAGSRFLRPAEKRYAYAPIEGEALAIAWSLEQSDI